jgi:solute carrier family 9 (sodium/hydrogen exchanger), member 8
VQVATDLAHSCTFPLNSTYPPTFAQSPEVFFFVLLPPIIFEAGYSLKKKDFFSNIGAISLFAVAGTVINCFVVGFLLFQAARMGIVSNVDKSNPMEALLFGALISSVDPLATLSIMGSTELQCNPLLYSLVFGESVLNDAIAISLFNVFASYYEKGAKGGVSASSSPFSYSQIAHALGTFALVSILSILVGIALGLLPSFLYRHTSLSDFPRLETSILLCFCYLCYSVGEALELSGIMALFFQGMVLAHYNSYNLSRTALLASEQIFATMATIAETAVFLYMGMSVFTEGFRHFSILLAVLSLVFCVVGRFLNILPLSLLSNLCRSESNRITMPMQCVLWFAGLRGAIAFALAMNMPGAHRDSYATTTLFICIFTTVVCGGLTDRVLTEFGMKQDGNETFRREEEESLAESAPGNGLRPDFALSSHRGSSRVYKGAKRLLKQFDDDFLKVYFGGSTPVTSASNGLAGDNRYRGNYELGNLDEVDDAEDSENSAQA